MKKLLLIKMRISIHQRPFLAFLLANLLLFSTAEGQKTWTGSANNRWNVPANWMPMGVPTSTDAVIIPSGSIVNIDVTPTTCASLEIQGGPSLTRVIIIRGHSLNVGGAVTIGAPTADNVQTRLVVDEGNLGCASITMADTDNGTRKCDLRLAPGTTANVSGNITMSGTASENIIRLEAGGTLNVGGNINGGGFNPALGTVNYNGSGPQSVLGDTYFNLIFSGGGEKTLADTVSVTGTCTFTDGIVNSTDATILEISDNATATGASGSSFVNGPVSKVGDDAFTFPIGRTGVGYAPIGISAPGVSETATAAYFPQSPPSAPLSGIIDHISALEYWDLVSTPGTSNVQITLSWRASSAVVEPPTLLVAALDAGVWANRGNNGVTGNATSGTVTSLAAGSINTFFTLAAATPANPLPIELTGFTGQQKPNHIHLSWRTATEQNNDYMTVERSADGMKFTELGRVKGAGTTQEPQEYFFVDEKPLRGTNYYRLRQVDYDGAFEYHKTISVLFEGKEGGLGVQAFPNPAQGSLQASWAPNPEQPTTLQVLDMTGRKLAEYQVPAGVGAYELPLNAVPAGLYILQARQGGEMEVMRFWVR